MQPAAYAKILDCARSAPQRPLLDLLNVRFLLTSAEAVPPGTRFQEKITSAEGLVLWENPDALPRAWLTTNATVTSLEAALARLCEPDFDPRRELLLTGPLPPPDPTATGSTQIAWDGPNQLNVRVQVSAPAYLVVAVSADPGWHAQLDGTPVPIALADGIYQAVWVPAGEHTVIFSYQPPLLGWGLLAASVGGAILLLALTRDIAVRRLSAVSRGAQPSLAPAEASHAITSEPSQRNR
nr:YfhO family protein [Thermomicrobium sp. CFH 73360]